MAALQPWVANFLPLNSHAAIPAHVRCWRGEWFEVRTFPLSIHEAAFRPIEKGGRRKTVWAQARNSNDAGEQWTNPKISFIERDCSASEIA
jgi:hypothetical protein